MTRLSLQHRKAIKVAWARFSTRTRLADLVLRVRRRRLNSTQVAILTYHRVLPARQASSVYSSPQIITTSEDFEAQIQYLDRHYRILSLEEYGELRKTPGSLPLKCAVVTFDDGWADNYFHALPILQKYSVPATIFLTTEFIGRKRTFWQEKLRFLIRTLWEDPLGQKRAMELILSPWAAEITQGGSFGDPIKVAELIIGKLKGENGGNGKLLVERLNRCAGNPEFPLEAHGFLTWDQVLEMTRYHISCGSHTHSHRLLSDLADDEIQEELRTSKQKIEMEMGREISTIAYPNGNYGPEIFALLQAAGYRLALTAQHGLNDFRTHPYELRRINAESQRFRDGRGRFSKALFAARLAGVL